MLSLETSETWAGAQITVTTDAAVVCTVTLFQEASAYDAMQTITAELTSALGGVWSWSWIRNPLDSGAKIILGVTGGGYAWGATLNATMQARLGIAASIISPTVQHTGISSASGTWAPAVRIAVRRHVRSLAGGDCGSALSLRTGVPGLAGIAPTVEAACTPQDAARLTSVLSVARNPRRAHIYQTHTASWRQLAIGKVSRTAVGQSLYSVTLECRGEAV
jgi:hypothetical protein